MVGRGLVSKLLIFSLNQKPDNVVTAIVPNRVDLPLFSYDCQGIDLRIKDCLFVVDRTDQVLTVGSDDPAPAILIKDHVLFQWELVQDLVSVEKTARLEDIDLTFQRVAPAEYIRRPISLRPFRPHCNLDLLPFDS